MRLKKSDIQSRVNKNLSIQFIRQDLTSYSGLELIKRYLRSIRLNDMIRNHLQHQITEGDYPFYKIILVIIGMLVLGFDRLSNISYVKDDPMMKRFCELEIIPSRFSILRLLKSISTESLKGFAALNLSHVASQLQKQKIKTVTIDIDGTVISSGGKPGMSAKGYNPIKKGAFSYFPLAAYCAQTGHFLGIQNRPGNVHDSNGSDTFIKNICEDLKKEISHPIRLQIRHDGAFFSEKNLKMYEKERIEYATKVPFCRYTVLKNIVAERKKWKRIDRKNSYFISNIKMDSWDEKRKFIFFRVEVPSKKRKETQLDLFSPDTMTYRYSAICTNMNLKPKNIYKFISGRSAQERAFAELKNDFAFDAIPSDSFEANSAYLQLSIMSYNLMTSFQIDGLGFGLKKKITRKVTRIFQNKRFKTIRSLIICRAGLLSKSNGKKKLCLTQNEATRIIYEKVIANLDSAA